MALAEERDDPQDPSPPVLRIPPLVHSDAVRAAVAVTSASCILTRPPWPHCILQSKPLKKSQTSPRPVVRGLSLGRASVTAALD